MADKNWQMDGRIMIPATVVACLLATVAPFGAACAAVNASDLVPSSIASDQLVWGVVLGGIVICGFVVSVVVSALYRVERPQLRRNAFVSLALNNIKQGVVITNPRQQIVFVNDRYFEIYGLSRSDVTPNMEGHKLLDLRIARGTLNVNAEDFFAKAGEPEGFITELPGGASIHVRYFRLPNGGSVATHEDCSEQRGLSRQLASTKQFLESVLENIPVALTVEQVSDRRYLLANRGAETILNRRREEVSGLTSAEIFNAREAKLIIARDEAAIKKRRPITEEHPISTKDGLRLFLTRRVTVLDEAGEPLYLIKTHEDVTDRRQTESRMAHMAYHDGLTDLPNRAAFLQALTQMIEACEETGEEFAVLSIDLDGLSEINDVFGHATGDKLLIEVGQRLQASARGGVVARLSGDEFGLIIDGKQPAAGMLLAEQIAETLAKEFVIDGKSVRTGITTGISIFPHNGEEAASLLANAGFALSRAKAKSRGTICIYEPEMDQQIRDRRVLHQDLSNAIRNGEISLYYQPQALSRQTAGTSEVIGFEALARWRHPTRGFVTPTDFIPLAEESGLIFEMGQWILREACREAASWPLPLQVAVNLSPAQFIHGDVVSLVHSILFETGLVPGRLELEITEGVLIEDFDRGLALLRRLKGLGVRISMDDFGSGYSSLSYLQAFPFDKIKIDRAFVMNLGRNPQSAAIVRAVIGLGHGLEMSIVAEGVETQEQLSFLAEQECDAVQGYFIGKPLPIDRYNALVGRARGDAIESARKTG